jgi:hypothetical protein
MISENDIRLSQAGHPQDEPESKYWWSGIALYGWVIAFALAGVGVLVFAG